MRWMVCLLALTVPAMADVWEPVFDDGAIFTALAGRTLVYDPYTFQWFGPEGDTQFVTERASDGRWAARGGQYCSQWPPSDTWACYDVQLSGQLVKFIGADRSESVGTYKIE